MTGKPTKRATQRDIARLAGISHSVVSMALKKHPGIPEETRLRVEEAAKKLGYAPDPMLSALASYRTGLRPANFHGTIAWLVNSSNGYNWRSIGHRAAYHAGARQGATLHGFKVEVFDLAERRMTAERMASIFQARNIACILLCPQPAADTEAEFPWDDFSIVTFGFTLRFPRLHTVAPDCFRATKETVRRLIGLGYRRIGFAMDENHLERTNYNYLGGYLAAMAITPCGNIPPLTGALPDQPRFKTWLEKHRPDAIIGGDYMHLLLQDLGYATPENIGFACPCLADRSTHLSGMWEDSPSIGVAAVNALVSAYVRGERGVPAVPQSILIDGLWHEGATLHHP